jgi:uncharacterized protein (TIGR02145 family)
MSEIKSIYTHQTNDLFLFEDFSSNPNYTDFTFYREEGNIRVLNGDLTWVQEQKTIALENMIKSVKGFNKTNSSIVAVGVKNQEGFPWSELPSTLGGAGFYWDEDNYILYTTLRDEDGEYLGVGIVYNINAIIGYKVITSLPISVKLTFDLISNKVTLYRYSQSFKSWQFMLDETLVVPNTDVYCVAGLLNYPSVAMFQEESKISELFFCNFDYLTERPYRQSKVVTKHMNIPQWRDTFDSLFVNKQEYDVYGNFTQSTGSLRWTNVANTSLAPKQQMVISKRFVPTSFDEVVVSGSFIEGTDLIQNGFGIYYDDNNYIMCHSNATVGKVLVVENGVITRYSGNNTVLYSMKIKYTRSTNTVRYYRSVGESQWDTLVTGTHTMPNKPAYLFVGTIKSNGSNVTNVNRSLSEVFFTTFDYSTRVPMFDNGNRFSYMSKIIPPPVPIIKHIYGYLYNGYTITESNNNGGFIDGFKVPSDIEWTTLITYLDGINIAGGKLKSTLTEPDEHPRWDIPNTGAINQVNFSALPGGDRYQIQQFNYIGHYGIWWSSTEALSYTLWYRKIVSDNSIIVRNHESKDAGISIRCIRVNSLTPQEQTLLDGSLIQSIQDYDGRIYEVIKIGTQAWIRQNLVCKHYANGTPIPEVTSKSAWFALTTGARCSYNNDETNAFIIE